MALIMTLALAIPGTPRPSTAGMAAMPWWGWLCGFAGAIYVTTVFTAIPAIGVSAAIGLTVASQQIASVFVDRHGLFRLPQRPVSTLRYLDVALLPGGIVLIRLV